MLLTVLLSLAICVCGSELEKVDEDITPILDDCKAPKTNKGFSLLCNAAAFGRLEKAKFLVENGADINESACGKLKPLHIAAALGHTRLVEFFIKKGQDIDDPGYNQCTALHYASRSGQLQVVKFVVDHGADVNARNVHGRTPLHFAVIGGSY